MAGRSGLEHRLEPRGHHEPLEPRLQQLGLRIANARNDSLVERTELHREQPEQRVALGLLTTERNALCSSLCPSLCKDPFAVRHDCLLRSWSELLQHATDLLES